MSKKLSVFISVVLASVMLLFTLLNAFAMGPAESGVYEVPIQMWHAEKEKTSMGDNYIVHTALLTVDGDKKTLTIAPSATSNDMQFWYYKDGSVEGDTIEVEQKNNVKIDGTTYQTAFEFPIKSDNEFVGVKFAASAMPLSPSARIKIDYSNAKKVGNVEKETTTKQTTTKPTTTTTTTSVEPTTEAKEEKVKNKKVPIAIACGAIGAVAVVLATTVVIKKSKKD